MRRLGIGVALSVGLLAAPPGAAAQTVHRQFVTVSVDNFRTLPLHFKDHPIEDLVGRAMAEAQREAYEYRSRDELTTADVVEFSRRGRGVGVTVYPFGLTTGPTIGIRGSYESLPAIRVAIVGPAHVSSYVLRDPRALDLSVGVFVSDRAPGWGLGSHAFAAGGFGRVRSELSEGTRYFGEAGGGLNVGPLGVQIAVKVARNHLVSPVAHSFYTVPISVRGTVGF